MHKVRKRRDIINRKDLTGRLDALAGWSGYSEKTRPEVLEIFKTVLDGGVAEVRRRFDDERMTGIDCVRANAFLIDQLVISIYEFALRYAYPLANPTTGEQLSICAIGGYGRAEMAPQSDIDLMFLLPYKQTPHTEQVVEFMLYMLWDLGLKVGHSTRSVGDAIRLAGEDLTIRTSQLEARWLGGDRELFGVFQKQFEKVVIEGGGPDFVEAKLSERDDRHERMGDTRYVLEPNIKEGKGGLRDLQTLLWIAKYLYRVEGVDELVDKGVLTDKDVRRFKKAENFLWTVRCHLHYLTGRPEERLVFDVQNTIGEKMEYTDRPGARGVERFMKHYFIIAKDVGDLTRVLCAVLEEGQKKKKFRFPMPSLRRRHIEGFALEGSRLSVESDDAFADEPIKLLRLFYEAQRHQLDVHPQALRLVTDNLRRIGKKYRRDPEANKLFLEMLCSKHDPETTLKRLNESGVFGRFIPDFGRVVAQMQYDMYHVYTVDEHTIRAIGILARIEAGELREDHPTASEAIHQLQSRRALYVAVMLHDIAKGRGGDHSELGAEVALELCPRLGLNEWETETVSWLVAHHLEMSRSAFKRDINDPKTAVDFARVVQSPERLRMLLTLTVVDIRAVGPGVWNGWKAALLRDLYNVTLEQLTGGSAGEHRTQRVAGAKQAFLHAATDADRKAAEMHVERGYPTYWLVFETETHLRHARMVCQAEEENLDLLIETRVDENRDCTEVTLYTADHPGLFSRIAGAMALGDANIVDAKIITLNNGMALDMFWVQDQDGGAISNPQRLERLQARIRGVLDGSQSPSQELATAKERALSNRTEVFKVPPRVLTDNKASANHTVIEVYGRDRQGFLYEITTALTRLGLQIASAHVSTYGERMVDVFYVKNVFGLKVDHDEKLLDIKKALREVVAGSEGGSDTDDVAAA